MSERINIDRLEIRLKGVSREAARVAASNLGSDLLGELAKRPGGTRANGNVDQLDGGTRGVTPPASPASLRRSIVAGIAASINSASTNGSRK